MDPLSFLANLLLSVTVGTLMVALAAYAGYKLREKRKPSDAQKVQSADDAAPVFVSLYVPGRDS
ncbi:MAG: hypothetical protein V7606_694 [Burkholderiales bacterium]|jgi:hypothetical protein